MITYGQLVDEIVLACILLGSYISATLFNWWDFRKIYDIHIDQKKYSYFIFQAQGIGWQRRVQTCSRRGDEQIRDFHLRQERQTLPGTLDFVDLVERRIVLLSLEAFSLSETFQI